jgi:hypothetical protein
MACICYQELTNNQDGKFSSRPTKQHNHNTIGQKPADYGITTPNTYGPKCASVTTLTVVRHQLQAKSKKPSDVTTMQASQKLLQNQLKAMAKEPVEGFKVEIIDESDMYKWRCYIQGPPDTPYEGGIFQYVNVNIELCIKAN